MEKQKKVLVVDDDPDILEAVRFILTDAGYDVVTNTGESVWDVVNTESPSILLLDVMLSGQDGREICRMLKRNEDTKKMPIIMFTAMTSNKDVVSKCGSEDFIAKPFDINELIGKIKMYS